MRRSPWTRPLLLLAVAAIGLGGQLARCRAARVEALSAVTFAEQIATDAARLAQLRDQKAVNKSQARPDSDVVSTAATVLEECGIPFSSVGSITADPAESAVVPGTGNDEPSSLRLSLRRVSIPRLGSFLKRWGESQAEWRMQSIRLTKSSPRTTETIISYAAEIQFVFSRTEGLQ
jgi:hypothetical protein